MGRRYEGSHRMLLSLHSRKRTLPIPYREILLTSSIMDSIFDQLRDRGPEQLAASRAQADIVDRTTSELQYLSHKALC